MGVEYQFRLRGKSDQWQFAGSSREADFTNLDSGEYRFEVVARVSGREWPSKAATVVLDIDPYFTETRAFLLLASFGGGGAVVTLFLGGRTLYRRKQKRLERQQLDMEQNRLSRDLHDNLGSELTRISQLSLQACESDGDGLGDEVLGRISELANQAIGKMNDLVWASDSQFDWLDELVGHIRERVAVYFSKTPIRCRFDFPSKIPRQAIPNLVRRNLFMICCEACQNVAKHSNANLIVFDLRLHRDSIVLQIKDDGCGYKPSDGRPQGSGIVNMRERAEQIGGRFLIEQVVGGGTLIHVEVPKSLP